MDPWTCGIPDDEFYSIVEQAEYEIAMAVADAADDEERAQSDFEEPDWVTISWAPLRRYPSSLSSLGITSPEEDDDSEDFVEQLIHHSSEEDMAVGMESEDSEDDIPVIDPDRSLEDLQAELDLQEEWFMGAYSAQPTTREDWATMRRDERYLAQLHRRVEELRQQQE